MMHGKRSATRAPGQASRLLSAPVFPRPTTGRVAASVQARRHKSGPYGYTQAKALVFSRTGEPADVLRLHTHSVSPILPDGAALVRTLAAPINPSDVNMIQGTYGTPATLSTVLGTAEPCAVPGNEGCLEVVALGAGVRGLRRGDWVLPVASGFGTFRTHALVEHADTALWPVGGDRGLQGLRPTQVAQVSVNPCSAWRMLRDYVDLVRASVQASGREGDAVSGGAWFLQNGANGGVGRAAMQLGRLWGLRSINVVRARESAEATAELKAELEALGATVVLTEDEFLDRSFASRLAECTGGGREPVLLGLNCVGGRSASQVARSLSARGCMVTYGGMSRQSFPFPTGQAIFKRLRLEGFWLSAWAREKRVERLRTMSEIIELMRDGSFQEAPVQELSWHSDTDVDTLKNAVQGTMAGFRSGKGMFVFGHT